VEDGALGRVAHRRAEGLAEVYRETTRRQRSLLPTRPDFRQSVGMHTVLDLDLDFFVWPIEHDRAENEGRLDPKEFLTQSEEQVRRFLEERCGLSRSNRIPGRRLVHHVEAFITWQEWLQKKMLAEPFAVIHVDAHSDLGAGAWNKSPKFFETELLASPLEHRRAPRMGIDAVNSGNYLIAAVASRWIAKLTYIYPTDPTPPDSDRIKAFAAAEKMQRYLSAGDDEEVPPTKDLPPYCFRDWPMTRYIELKMYSLADYERCDWSNPVHVEPQVPFEVESAAAFKFSEFTQMVVAQSPSYTPETVDPLLDIIEGYYTAA